jgi:hypothetical protein
LGSLYMGEEDDREKASEACSVAGYCLTYASPLS